MASRWIDADDGPPAVEQLDLEQAARFFALSRDLFCVVDLQGVIRCVNDSVTQMLGYEPAEVVCRSAFDFVMPEDQDVLSVRLRWAGAGHATGDFECRCRHRDGSHRWLAFSCPSPSADERRLLLIGRDVTAQKKLQRELLEWKERYEAAALAAGNVVYEYDTETDRVVWDGGFESLLGYRIEEMAEGLEGWLSAIHPDDRFVATWALEHVLAEKEPAHLEYRVRRKDGTYIHVQDDAQFFRAHDGNRAKLIGCLKNVSERRWAEERFRRLVEAVQAGILLVDMQGRIAFANSRVEAIFGYAADELREQEVELLIPQRFRDRHRQDRATYTAAPTSRPMGAGLLLWGRHKDGREFPVDVALSPISTGNQSMTVCTVVDLSERFTAQKAQLDSDLRLQDILDNASAVMYVKDLEGRYLLINRKFEELFHVSRAAIVGKTDSDCFPPESAAAFWANDRLVLESGEVLETEEVAPQDDGLHTYISVKFPLHDADSRIYAVAGISTDITERASAHHEVQQVQRRMELLVNSITDGIYGVDLQGMTTFVNTAAEQMLGRPAAEAVGRHYSETLRVSYSDGSPIAEEDGLIQRSLRSGQIHQADDRLFYRADGTSFPVEYRSTPLEENGELVGAVLTFHDVTERKLRQRAEHELQAARRVQQRLYPESAPEVPGFDLAGAVFPATQACGDYFDFIPLANGNLALVVADVAGHGLASALQMVQTRAYLRAMLADGLPPAEALRRLNLLMLHDMPQEAFVTLFLTILDPRGRSIMYAGAGHEARLLRAGGTVEDLPSTGLVLGVLPDAPLQTRGPWELKPGDLLLMLTDGVLESHSPQRKLFGWERTLAVVRDHRDRSAAEIIQALYQAAGSFAADRHQADDMTVLVAKSL